MNIFKQLGIVIQNPKYKFVKHPMINWFNPLTYIVFPVAFIVMLINRK